LPLERDWIVRGQYPAPLHNIVLYLGFKHTGVLYRDKKSLACEVEPV